MKRNFCGETIGTFLLVFFGCGSVMVSVLFSAFSSLFEVAVIWGIGVTLAIYAARGLSCAHLNPAVSIAFVLAKRMTAKKLPVYLIAQFVGAFLGACLLYFTFSTVITSFELTNGILRGSPESIRTAMMFGEYFPNPAFKTVGTLSIFYAFLGEFVGTFLLVLSIFFLTEGCNVGRPDSSVAPAFVGFAVTVIICIIAPLTQAGLNPARDFGPRLLAYLCGWGGIAIPGPRGGFFTVYVLAPILGGILAALCFTKLFEPLLHREIQIQRCL